MTLLTAIEIANNYPDNIVISARQISSGKWVSFMGRTKEGSYHKDLISFDPETPFSSEKEAIDAMHDTAKRIIEYVVELNSSKERV